MILTGALCGALIGVAAVVAVRCLPGGIDERLEQPPWTRHATRARTLLLAGALLGGLVGGASRDASALVLGLLLVAVLLPATAIDIRWRVVPDTLVVLGSVGGLAVIALARPDDVVTHLVAGALGGLAALALALAARGGFGLGDVKLIAMAGLVLGTALPVAMVVGLLAAGLAALALLVRRGRGATLPLVPFLAAGILASLAWPENALMSLS